MRRGVQHHKKHHHAKESQGIFASLKGILSGGHRKKGSKSGAGTTVGAGETQTEGGGTKATEPADGTEVPANDVQNGVCSYYLSMRPRSPPSSYSSSAAWAGLVIRCYSWTRTDATFLISPYILGHHIHMSPFPRVLLPTSPRTSMTSLPLLLPPSPVQIIPMQTCRASPPSVDVDAVDP